MASPDDRNDAGPSGASNGPAAQRTTKIRGLNDGLRHTFEGGDVVMTAGVRALPIEEMVRVLREVQRFDAFGPDNGPHGEHDFGRIERSGQAFFWKIDCYDKGRKHGSPDPANPDVTTRVLTVMLAEEY